MRDLQGIGAIGIDAPDLRRAALAAGVVDTFAIGRPARAFGRSDELTRRAASGERDGPDGFNALIGGEVGSADGKSDGPAVGGNLGIADALDFEQSVGIERLLLG